MPTELTLLAWTVVLGLIQIVATGVLASSRRGFSYAIGPRDTPAEPLAGVPGRMERATRNLLETFPLAAAAILIAVIGNRTGPATALGVQLYFWGRVVYVPLSCLGVPWLRSIAWGVSLIGVLLVLGAVLLG